MSNSQKEKQKFRQSAKWKKFRLFKKKEQDGLDLITQKKLYKGFTVHHLDLDQSHYQDLSAPEHFLACNKKTHDNIHWLYDYYKNDKQILERIKVYLDLMLEINKGGE